MSSEILQRRTEEIEVFLSRMEDEAVLPSSFVEPLVTIIRQQQEIIERLTQKSTLENCVLKVKLLSETSQLPQYAHEGDAGLDLFSTAKVTVQPGESALISTGISIQLPPETEAQIRPRSGLALKHQVTVLNTPGTIDQGYRGEIGVILINHGKFPFQVEIGMKIAQMVIKPVLSVKVKNVEELDETDRGTGGFGSTGT